MSTFSQFGDVFKHEPRYVTSDFFVNLFIHGVDKDKLKFELDVFKFDRLNF